MIFDNGFETVIDNAVVEYEESRRIDLYYGCETQVSGRVFSMDCLGVRKEVVEVPRGSGQYVVLHTRTPDFLNSKRCEYNGTVPMRDGSTYFFVCEEE